MQEVGHQVFWQTLRALLVRVAGATERDGFFDECLDAVIDVLGADRGLVVLFQSDGTTRAVQGRAAGRALSPTEIQEISRSIIDRVRDEQAPVVWDSLEGADGSASMHQLGITSAMAAPLLPPGWDATSPVRGVVYVDFRGMTTTDLRELVGFLEAVCALLAAVSEQQEAVVRARRDAEDERRRARTLPPPPPLATLLAAPSLAELREELSSAVDGALPVLILGESGVGKTLFARALAEAGRRRPVVRATLGASDDLNTITSELFGHVRGAFSGAHSKRAGVVGYADGGTLILDEVLNLPMHAQQLLLDFTQFGTYRPLGYDAAEPLRADVRIVAATNGDLEAAVADGRFRQDLYFRLAGVTVELAPLRARRADVVPLAEAFLARADGRVWTIELDARRALASPDLDWQGNVRQLEAVVLRSRERAIAADPATRTLTAAHVVPSLRIARSKSRPTRSPGESATAPSGASAAGGVPLVDAARPGESFAGLEAARAALDVAEKRLIEETLVRSRGVVAYAAKDLGMPRSSLLSRITTLGIERPERG